MTSVETHPESLLRSARSNTLDRASRVELEAHLAQCSVCTMELRIASDLLKAPRDADDSVLIDRLVEGVMAVTEGRTQRAVVVPFDGARARRHRERSWRVVPVWAAAATALLCAGVTGATAWWLTRPAEEVPSIERPLKSNSRSSSPDNASVEEATEPDEVRARVPRTRAAPDSEPTAEELLAQAGAARSAGEPRAAARIYQELQRRYPSSREHRVSCVAFGRLLLDELHDSRGALAQFDSYLRQARGGALAQEARVGRAVSLERLGRARAERVAWQDLLRQHPETAYADHARARLHALDSRQTPPP